MLDNDTAWSTYTVWTSGYQNIRIWAQKLTWETQYALKSKDFGARLQVPDDWLSTKHRTDRPSTSNESTPNPINRSRLKWVPDFVLGSFTRKTTIAC